MAPKSGKRGKKQGSATEGQGSLWDHLPDASPPAAPTQVTAGHASPQPKAPTLAPVVGPPAVRGFLRALAPKLITLARSALFWLWKILNGAFHKLAEKVATAVLVLILFLALGFIGVMKFDPLEYLTRTFDDFEKQLLSKRIPSEGPRQLDTGTIAPKTPEATREPRVLPVQPQGAWTVDVYPERE